MCWSTPVHRVFKNGQNQNQKIDLVAYIICHTSDNCTYVLITD